MHEMININISFEKCEHVGSIDLLVWILIKITM